MRKHKSGFTLIELMVVAIIVAILAAVAIPLMSGNKDRAIATEAQAGIGTIVTALKVHITEEGSAPGSVAGAALSTTLSTLKDNELDGKYFNQADYRVIDSDYDNATGTIDYEIDVDGGAVGLFVTSDGDGTNVWYGTLLNVDEP
ncbi:prepilin-type N-terminal cleavage/methylation domain-containing protein [Verrucomicrobiota bacterium]